ncbi:hypothetical protein EI94DRAFT_1704351 [Lactarius quietus]|nr:hypothetical protein EI94DRAFT_1704351 [Lactarius quietus]
MHPSFLPVSILWDYNDCVNDKSEGIIVMEANKRRPKMSLAIHHPDGTKISSQEYSKIRCSVDLIMKKLITTTFLRKWFLAEYDQATLELEAQQTILHLCSAHWKADTLIRQMLLQRSETGSKDTPHNVASANSAPTAPTNIAPMARTNTAPVAPVNTTKRVFEHSPGPKSPSALHVQKRSKDEAALTQQKTTSSITAYNLQCPAAPKLVPSFLSHTEVICAETAPTNFQPISVDPSGASTTHLQRKIFDSVKITADNIIAILTSDFPLLKNTPHLIHSMNAQWSFTEGEPFENVATLLEHVQFADPGILDLDEDNMGKGWGHYQFTAGCGSIATAFKLVAAAIETCQEARLMDTNTTTPRQADLSATYTLKELLSVSKIAGLMLCDTTMSSPVQGLKIKIKQPVNAAGADNTASQVPAGNDSTHQQPAANAEPSTVHFCLTMKLSLTHRLQSAGVDAVSLKTLQVPELQAWISSHGLVMPKSKRKDDLIMVIVSSPKFMQVTKLTIEDIVKKCSTLA